MAGKDKLEFDVLANDKASGKFDRIASAGKSAGKALKSAFDKSEQGLKSLSKGADKAKESLGKLGDQGKQGLGKLVEGLKAGPAALIGVGLGLGALVMGGFQDAMEKQDAAALLTAQLGASDAEMGKLGKIAGDMYKDAFGESVTDVSATMKTVFQSGLAAVKDSEDKIKGVTAQVMNYSKITGEEALPVTRAISQMLKTGLAKNATEAFDLLTRGVQKGLDKSEDLLDTVNEYGTQFRKLGLNGTQAFGLISQAIQAGARDSDVAADAIKEFSIRAQDGSKTAAASYKALGLNAKQMSKDVAEGGPKATKALDTVLDRLRAAKDRSDFATIAFGLFGTQSEDLGAALTAMDLDTAASDFGKVAGAAERAGDVINNTASNKLATVGRTIKMSIADAIGKYALPKLEQFADWFNGPGKMVMVGWAIDGAQAFVGMADKVLGALQAMLGGLASYGKVALIAAAGSIAVFNPSMAFNMLKQADALGDWANKAKDGIGTARKELKGWNDTLSKAKTKVTLQAEIEGLEQNIAKAQRQLRDPGLTKTRRAELTANIAQLTKKKDEALRKLNDPSLIKTRVAKLEADKRNLDTKIAQAKAALNHKGLTATKTAKLKAEISQLLRQKANAQAAINSLTGKTVTVNIVQKYTSTGVNLTSPSSVGRRAGGGPVTKGEAYIVGENRPELFIPKQDGMIIPEVPNRGSGRGMPMYAGNSHTVPLVIGSDGSQLGTLLVNLLAKTLKANGGDVKILKAAGF